MDLTEPLKSIPFIQALYCTLRECRLNYNANDYKWRLGEAVIADIERQDNIFFNTVANNKENKKRTLYGIDVEIDYCNPYNLQLFEDITNKIAIYEILQTK